MDFNPANLIVPLDEMRLPQARKIVELLKPTGCRFKVGMQLHGAFAGLPTCLQDFLTGPQMMLDLKRHDIPNTVVHTVYDDCMTFSPAFYTINVPLNDASFAAAIARNAPEFPDTTFLGITVLTSVSDGSDGGANQLARATAGRFTAAPQAVQYYAELAAPATYHPNVGLVCSPQEVATLRQNPRTARLRYVCPGIRPAGAALNDQARVATPVVALQDGAHALVIGRPITGAPDPLAALEAILAEIAAA